MGIEYVHEKAEVALSLLAASPDPLRDRIMSAYIHALMSLELEALPAEAESRLEDVTNRLTGTEAEGEEGSVTASVEALGDVELRAIAESIVELACQLICWSGRD